MMDAQENHAYDGRTMRVSPKGELLRLLRETNKFTLDQAEDLWLRFEAFAQRRIRDDYPEAEFAALLFDGNGGEIVGYWGHDEQ